MSSRLERNNTIDLFRFLISPLILLIHCRLSGDIGQAIVNFSRFGVPFFLLVSGWFSYAHSTEKMIEYARKKLCDTVKLLGVFFVAYFIMNSLACLFSGEMFLSWTLKYTNVKALAYLTLFNRALFFGSTGYYPFMLVYVYIIFIFLLKKNKLKYGFLAIPILLTTNILLSAFTDIPWFCYGNFLFTGLPFFLFGHCLHKEHKKLMFSPQLWCIIFLIGTGLTFIEAAFNKEQYCYIGSILMAVALLMFSISHNIEVRDAAWLNKATRVSLYIFIIHCGIQDVLRAFLACKQIVLSNNVFVVMVLFISLAVSVIWDYFATNKSKKGISIVNI